MLRHPTASKYVPFSCRLLFEWRLLARSTGYWRLDIAFGTTVVFPDIPMMIFLALLSTQGPLLLPLQIPAGTQVQASIQGNGTTAGYDLYAALYGIY